MEAKKQELTFNVSTEFFILMFGILINTPSLMLDDSHFEILGVTRDATAQEIKKAFRKQIKKWHPDKFQDQPDKLSQAIEISKHLNTAFELLKNYIPPAQAALQAGKPKFPDSKSASKRTGKPDFHRVKINSPNIWTIGYDAFTRTLQVEFYESGTYHYFDVPEAVYKQLMYADPADDFLSKNITWKYRWERI